MAVLSLLIHVAVKLQMHYHQSDRIGSLKAAFIHCGCPHRPQLDSTPRAP
uniref:Uncharacterized protein n=1 Tax=Setaria italica TaxID=4555 RepID=K3YKS5_SETIT